MTLAHAPARLPAIDWTAGEQSLDGQGFAPLPVLISADECDSLARLYQDDSRFRS